MAKLEVRVEARNMLAKGLAGARAALGEFAKIAAKVGIAAGAALAGMAAKAVHAFGVQEKVERSLVEAMKAHGEAGDILLPKLRALAGAIQDETGVGDENTLSRMAQLRLLGVQTDALGDAAKGVIALTHAGMGEEAATRAMAGATMGNYEALTRYIPALRQTTDQSEKARIVADFLAKSYAAQKGELNTVSGQFQALKGRIGDVWEEVGSAISKNGALTETLKKAGDAVKEFGSRIAQWVGSGGAEAAFARVGTAIETMRGALAKAIALRFEIAAGLITAAVAALTVKIYALAKGSALLSTAINRASIAAAAKAVQLKLMGLAATGATAKVIALRVAVLSLQGVAFAGIAAGFAAIATAAFRAGQAADQLNKTLAARAAFDAQAKGKWGVGADTMQTAREALQSGDTATIEKLDRLYPGLTDKVRAHWQELKKTETAAKAAEDAITSLGNATGDAAENAADFVGPKMPAGVEWLRKGEAIAAERAAEEKKRLIDEIAAKQEEAAQNELAIQDELKRGVEEKHRAAMEAAEEEIRAQEELAAKTVEAFIADKRAGEDAAKAAKKEDEREARILAKKGRNIKLSKRDQEFLEARNAIRGAQGAMGQAQEDLKVAKDNLLQSTNSAQTLEKLLAEQKAINKDLKQLLAQG